VASDHPRRRATGMIRVVVATTDDLDAIDYISRASFPTPWPRRTFEDELGRRHGRLEVARNPERVVGYVNYWIVADEVHLLAIASHPEYRATGVGALLMDRVIERARHADSRIVTLEVRAGNHAARRLYERYKFAVISTRSGYYNDDNEDAVIMIREM
jgi:[ribosomal protein S18]-alanine N-acetyltransferase